MNLSQPSLSIKPSQLTDSLNVEIRDGAVRTRSGFKFVKDNTGQPNLPQIILGIHHDRNFHIGAPTNKLVVIGQEGSGETTPNRVEAGLSLDGGATWSSVVAPDNDLSATYDYHMSFATAIDDETGNGLPTHRYLLACISPTHPHYPRDTVTQENFIMEYNGTSWSNMTADFTGSGSTNVMANKILIYFGRLVLFGYGEAGGSNSVEIIWSAQDDHDDFHDGGSSNVFITDGGGAIVDAYPLRDQLVCYKENSILVGTRLTTSPYIRWFPQVTDVGLMGPNMVGVYRDMHFFVGTNNIYIYRGGAELIPIGKPIWSQFLEDMRDGGASATKLYRHRCFTAVHHDTAQIAFWIVTGTNNFPTKAYVYSVDDNAWTTWESPDDNSNKAEFKGVGLYKHDNTVNDAEIIPYYFDTATNDSIVSKYDFSTLTDYDPDASGSTIAITSHATTKDFAISLQDRNVWEEALFEVRGRAAASATTVSASYDGGSTAFLDSQSWSLGNTQNEVIKFRVGGGGGYKVRYKISSDTAGKGFVWNSLEIIAQARDAMEDSL